MFIEIIRAIIFVVCYIIAISLSFYLEMLYENNVITGDFADLIVLSPTILVNILFGFYTIKFKHIIWLSLYGSLVLTAVVYTENYFDPAEQSAQPDLTDLAFSNPIPYGLLFICFSLFFSSFPLSIGWIFM